MTGSGAELIRQMVAGDREAFARFYDRYAPLVFPLIQRILRERADASDVLQEVFWEAWQGAAGYDPARGSPEAWLVTRARTRAIDRIRAMRRRSETFVAPLHDALAAARRAAARGQAGVALSDRGGGAHGLAAPRAGARLLAVDRRRGCGSDRRRCVHGRLRRRALRGAARADGPRACGDASALGGRDRRPERPARRLPERCGPAARPGDEGGDAPGPGPEPRGDGGGDLAPDGGWP